MLISPWYALFGDVPRAYDAIRLYQLDPDVDRRVPAYFIARRLAGQRWALAAAAFAVSIPPMLYTSVVMTENAFYPAFMLFVWALVAALERPRRSASSRSSRRSVSPMSSAPRRSRCCRRS